MLARKARFTRLIRDLRCAGCMMPDTGKAGSGVKIRAPPGPEDALAFLAVLLAAGDLVFNRALSSAFGRFLRNRVPR